MEENKYLCPKCGSEIVAVYEKPALNLSCPKCGCKTVTTKWEEIDLDSTIYVLKLNKIESPTIDVLLLVSKLTGENYLTIKKNLMKGDIIFKGRAIEIMDLKKIFDEAGIKYSINPDFRY